MDFIDYAAVALVIAGAAMVAMIINLARDEVRRNKNRSRLQ